MQRPTCPVDILSAELSSFSKAAPRDDLVMVSVV